MTTSIRDAYVTIYVVNGECNVDIRAADLIGKGLRGTYGPGPPPADQAFRFLAQLACPNLADLKGGSTELGFVPVTFPLNLTPLLQMLIMGPTDLIVATLLCDMGKVILPDNLLNGLTKIVWNA